MISKTAKDILTKQLKIDEGIRLDVYQCTANKLTIGIGRNLQDKGLSKAECDYLKLGTYDKNAVIAKLEVRGITLPEAEYLLSNDIDQFSAELEKRLSWFDKLPEAAKIVLINMCFNLGIGGLMDFRKTLLAIKYGDYKQASIEMLNSNWSKQVGQRANRLSKLLAS